MSPREGENRSREGPRGRKKGGVTPGDMLQLGLVTPGTYLNKYRVKLG